MDGHNRRSAPLPQEQARKQPFYVCAPATGSLRQGLSRHGAASFQKRAQYQEERRCAAAARHAPWQDTRSAEEQESAWKNAEVMRCKARRRGRSRGRSPRLLNDVLIMELVTDAAGNPAPRLGEVDLPPELALEYHQF